MRSKAGTPTGMQICQDKMIIGVFYLRVPLFFRKIWIAANKNIKNIYWVLTKSNKLYII